MPDDKTQLEERLEEIEDDLSQTDARIENLEHDNEALRKENAALKGEVSTLGTKIEEQIRRMPRAKVL